MRNYPFSDLYHSWQSRNLDLITNIELRVEWILQHNHGFNQKYFEYLIRERINDAYIAHFEKDIEIMAKVMFDACDNFFSKTCDELLEYTPKEIFEEIDRKIEIQNFQNWADDIIATIEAVMFDLWIYRWRF
ncbi:MAG: hypothetical protein ACD_4C00115G0001 [uncultured bacterium (gcode 4)]|uniref:Uncharacterized protein n=1 Tax=uncultured bacterium (gcode 4) TaxID=1234023 RepID=K2GUA7_9BACT|nr:MAG: hypothetical protein ACD_4C00115G0001 [uncultured bacterium (gcode 4)]